MTDLVYLSPVPWFSFSQRPHKFVEWYHARQGGEVLWVEPYPTRLPTLRDVRRLLSARGDGPLQPAMPAWLRVIKPSALPVEPLPWSGWLNRPLWRSVMAEIERFCSRGPATLVVGKPSQLALDLMGKPWFGSAVFDSMDHFSAFYRGISRRVMAGREHEVARRADVVMASSTLLCEQWEPVCGSVIPVFNACDPAVLPSPRSADLATRSRPVFGYVGTIAPWFDWAAVQALAMACPDASVRLIGPVFGVVPANLPANIELLPPCSHESAMIAVQDFDVGLIPFLLNTLTDSVDPIKYYEYRAMGLPVLSTRFGEMRQRGHEAGVFLADTPEELREMSRRALEYREPRDAALAFRDENSWAKRFDGSSVADRLFAPAQVS